MNNKKKTFTRTLHLYYKKISSSLPKPHLHWDSRATNLTQDINIAVPERAVLALTTSVTLRPSV